MAGKLKKLLLVDDSEIDRGILKSILSDDYEITEADNGYSALKIIPKIINQLDAILLDVSMPILDGFSVLRLMKENKLDKVPVFLITAEATQDNVERAAQYNVSEFIRKPFEREEILKRLKSRLGVVLKHDLTDKDIKKTKKYIAHLEAVYNKYLTNTGKDSGHYSRIVDLMRILLKKYSSTEKGTGINYAQIDIISKAAYFYDIGNMLLPSNLKFGMVKQEGRSTELYQSHTVLGADIVQLNYSKHCEYFVHVCSDMCMHHHERFDGSGFPHRIQGNNNSIYTQMCRIAMEFDNLFFKYGEHKETQFNFVMSELAQDKGVVSKKVLSLLTECQTAIILYYNEKC